MTDIPSCCHEACKAFDAILRDRPDITHERLASAIHQIIVFRDALIGERRADRTDNRTDALLPAVNSILSLAASAEFPLVGVRWDRIVAIRAALAEFDRELSTGESGDKPQ